ncbi:MAG TPA: flagellar hook protein FlgE [Methylophilaceae bacterium]|jgi:flagellar hook protein FlgE
MSFQQGLSGLNAASKSLEVIGNNVSNSSTVGFKQSRAEFSDVFASSLTGAGSSQIGIGTKLSNVAQQFTQGNISSTSNSLDVAINGGGFFRMSNNGAVTYSRNGQFTMDKQGYLTDAQGNRLTGYLANSLGVLSTGAATDIQINSADLNPTQTTTVTGTLNLDSTKAALTNAGFSPTNPSTYTSSTSVNVFDSLGNSHVLQSFFVKTGAGAWSVFNTVDGNAAYPTSPQAPNSTLTFPTSGLSPTQTVVNATSFAPGTGAATPMTVALDYSTSTQFGSAFSVNSLAQDGNNSGKLAKFNVGSDGVITGSYTNGKSQTLGQLVLVKFANPNGLVQLGGNQWGESSTSGVPVVGTPNTSGLGVLQSSALEDSNVDLTSELVNMITAQRIYQANAQTIKTEDQIMQTLVNLR